MWKNLLGEQLEEIPPILTSHNRVQVRIGTRIQRVEEDEQDFGLGHIDQREPGKCSAGKECNGSPTDKIREHQQRHFLGNLQFRSSGLLAQGIINEGVANDNHQESDSVDQDQAD